MHYLLAPLVFASFLSTNKTKQEVPAMESLLPLLSAVDTMEGDTQKKKKKNPPSVEFVTLLLSEGRRPGHRSKDGCG